MDFPLDLLRCILAFVPGWDIIRNVSRVSKSLHKLSQDRVMWKLFCERACINIAEEELPKREDRYQWLWLCKNNKQDLENINKSKFVGYFKKDKYTYEGDFLNGNAHGFGKEIDSESVSIGEFYNGKLHGYAVTKFNDGDSYKGQYFNGMTTGMGTYHWVKLGIYEGNSYNNQNEGFGIHRQNDGNIYEGNWHQDKRYGHGKFLFFDGFTFIGSWLDSKRNGYGQLLKDGQVVYEGNWANDMPDGFSNHWNGYFLLYTGQRKEFIEKIQSGNGKY